MMISGDVDSRADFDCAAIAKRVYKDIGYDDVVEPFVHLGTTEREWAALVSKARRVSRRFVMGLPRGRRGDVATGAGICARACSST